MKRIFPIMLAALFAALAAGCVTHTARVPALDKAEVVALVKQGVPDDVIIRRIEDTGSVFYLTSNEVVELRQAGLSDKLVTYLMYTRVREAIEQTRRTYEGPYLHGGVGVIYSR